MGRIAVNQSPCGCKAGVDPLRTLEHYAQASIMSNWRAPAFGIVLENIDRPDDAISIRSLIKIKESAAISHPMRLCAGWYKGED